MEYYKSLGATDRRTDGHWLSVTLDSQDPQQEKGWLMVMADPSDLGHGKKKNPSVHLPCSSKMIFVFVFIPVNALVKKFCIFPSTEIFLMSFLFFTKWQN